jgi:hypothetical protein
VAEIWGADSGRFWAMPEKLVNGDKVKSLKCAAVFRPISGKSSLAEMEISIIAGQMNVDKRS